MSDLSIDADVLTIPSLIFMEGRGQKVQKLTQIWTFSRVEERYMKTKNKPRKCRLPKF